MKTHVDRPRRDLPRAVTELQRPTVGRAAPSLAGATEPSPADAFHPAPVGAARASAPGSEPFPFSAGARGGLSPAVDFSKFLDDSRPENAQPTDQTVLQMARTTLADYLRTGQFGSLQGERGLTLRYAVFAPPPGTPVKKVINVALGRDETFAKYAELLFNLKDLRAQGYVVALMDHRGVGFSDRELTDDPERHALTDFDDMVKDQRHFTEVLRTHFGAATPLTFVGTSLGGGVATRYLQQHPGEYRQAVLLAPMLDIETHLPDVVESALANVVGTVFPRAFALGQGRFEPKRFEGNTLTDCPQRFEVPNLLAERHPQVRVGGTTWSFAKTSVAATREMMKPEAMERLRGVDLRLLAASHDTRVETRAIEQLAAHLGLEPKVLRGRNPDGSARDSLHDLLSLRDDVRGQVVAELRAAMLAPEAAR